MAATMMAAPMSAFADDPVNVVTGTITGNGEVHYVNTKVYNVILPTNDSLNFHVDPTGILSLTGPTDLETVLSNAAINGGVTSSATAVINKSSMNINVNVEVNVVGGTAGGTATEAAVNLVDSPEKAVSQYSDASHAALYLAITPLSGAAFSSVVTSAAVTGEADFNPDGSKYVTGAAYSLSNASVLVNTNVTALTDEAITANGPVADVSGTALKFSLAGMPENYTVNTNSTIAVIDETKAAATLNQGSSSRPGGNMYVFTITGKADPDSDVWREFTNDPTWGSTPAQQELKLSMKFVITSGESLAKEAYYTLVGSTYWIRPTSDDSVAFTGTPRVLINGVEPNGASDVTVTSSNMVTITATVVNWYKANRGGCVLTITDANGEYTITL